jgi:hypothetical protein
MWPSAKLHHGPYNVAAHLTLYQMHVSDMTLLCSNNYNMIRPQEF